MMRVSLELEPTLMLGRPEALFAGPYSQGNGGRNWDIAPDGQRFLLTRPSGSTDAAGGGPRVVIVQNWFTELERLLPAD